MTTNPSIRDADGGEAPAPCPACGYPAVRTGRTTCPECGLSYDLTRSKRRRIVEWVLWTLASALVTTIGYTIIAVATLDSLEMLFVAMVFGAVGVSIFQGSVLCATVLRRGLTVERFVLVLASHVGLMLVTAPIVYALILILAMTAWAMGW